MTPRLPRNGSGTRDGGLIMHDDDLAQFDAHGLALPAGGEARRTDTAGASIWHYSYGVGDPVILLHGGLGHSGNFAHQIPSIVTSGRRAIAIDSRGHGRSTRDVQPFSYALMASDVLAVMDALGIGRATIVGWSDGACIGLLLAKDRPERVAELLFFACNVDSTGTLPFAMTAAIGHCISRHRKDFEVLNPMAGGFDALMADLQPMQSGQPNYSADDLASIGVRVTVVQAEGDEFIRRDHAEYIARTIPDARYELLPDVTHFAPIQRPEVFNAAMLGFFDGRRLS